jgi:hypothetical protein
MMGSGCIVLIVWWLMMLLLAQDVGICNFKIRSVVCGLFDVSRLVDWRLSQASIVD